MRTRARAATFDFTDPPFLASLVNHVLSANANAQMPKTHQPAEPLADELICAVLRNERPSWLPGIPAQQGAEAFHKRCDLHGVNALLHGKLQGSGWPEIVLQTVRSKAIQLAMWEMRHQQLLEEILSALDGAGVSQPLVLKGTALAYSLYPDPALRTRGDTDLLVAPQDRERAAAVLASLGYERTLGVAGEFVSYQATFVRRVDGAPHAIDLHWKINNSELLSALFTYAELLRDSRPLLALGIRARAPANEQSLLIACMHRASHKQNPYYVNGDAGHDPNRLIWLYDVHLLSASLTANAWDRFTAAACEKGLRAICLEAMALAAACFHTAYPDPVVSALASTGRREAPHTYLSGSKLRQQWMDFRALESAAKQWQLLAELVLPPPSYIRARYATAKGAWLPWLYLRRAASGIAKRVIRSNSRP